MSENRKPRSLFFSLLLVSAGLLLFMINTGKVQGGIWENARIFWPVILIIGGLDGIYRRDGWVGPLVLLGMGTVFLLGNLHILESGGLSLLVKFWPLILVAIGLDVILGRQRSVWNSLIRIALGLFLVGAIIWLTSFSPWMGVGMKSVPFSQKLDQAAHSKVTFSMAIGEMDLSGGAARDILVSGNAGLPGELTLIPLYLAPKDGTSSLLLEEKGTVIGPISSDSKPWNFDINSTIPIDLQAELGVGKMKIDLTGTHVGDLQTEIAVGTSILTFSEGVDVNAIIKGAIGEVIIEIPKGSEVTMQVDKAITSLTLPDGYSRNGDSIYSPGASSIASKIDLQIDWAIGSIVIREIN
ncbi:MAG: DUF5668 domain-containing protein [Chloroflexi bacterium]|nr:DUF5668 domain-containing protein [Chloroflexota bacterium]